ncbi:unnamed protein product [Anisakis simplex]|uniref:Uncharacterized protein n=1 Tax=Anisakis simplex TaxID=6269 RepID=A0A3P6Q1Z4_ANISI|nr:unnamed protein product [Anisakis simplex]
MAPQVTSPSQQQVNQQNMVNGQANVAQLQQAQYPMQQQSMAQPVTSNGKMQVPISSASNPVLSAAYNGKVIPQQQQQSFMYPQQQGMISQAQPQTMLVGSDYSVYQQQPAAGVIPNSLPQQLNSSYTMPSVDNANSITAQQYANQQQYANTYQVIGRSIL